MFSSNQQFDSSNSGWYFCQYVILLKGSVVNHLSLEETHCIILLALEKHPLLGLWDGDREADASTTLVIEPFNTLLIGLDSIPLIVSSIINYHQVMNADLRKFSENGTLDVAQPSWKMWCMQKNVCGKTTQVTRFKSALKVMRPQQH